MRAPGVLLGALFLSPAGPAGPLYAEEGDDPWLARPALWAVGFYRQQVRPALGQRCSLTPSCSQYGVEALHSHGLLGLAMIADRGVREPAVVAARANPVRAQGRTKYSDPLRDHDGWMSAPSADLAETLATEDSHAAAAVEYRRLARAASNTQHRAGFYWAAAYEYVRSGDVARAERMLDRAEDAATTLKHPALLLRAEAALHTGRPGDAAFLYETLISTSPREDLGRLAARRLAHARLQTDDPEGAMQALPVEPDAAGAREAIDTYRNGTDKRPWLGGLLGLLPGLGYAYAGEYANGLRSLLLNSLFIYGLVETAEDNQWGGFGVISFFELTWYSGSIYGGLDASHRANQRRLDKCLEAIDGNAAFSPDFGRLPLVTLRFTF